MAPGEKLSKKIMLNINWKSFLAYKYTQQSALRCINDTSDTM